MKTQRSILAAVAALLLSALPTPAADQWVRLSDPQHLKGWHIIGKGQWDIEEGAIRGRHAASEKEFSHLVTDRIFTNFVVRLKFKAVRGNSGFYFRVEETGYSGISGFQAEIDPEKDTGGLYETNGRSWVSQPTAAEVKSYFKPGEWNEMTIAARGRHVVVTVNGKQSAELTNDPGRTHGRLALQLHGDQDVEVWFKDIEIKVE